MDPLSDVMETLKLAGSLYCRTELSAPWGLALPPAEYAHFHVVERGSCWLRLQDEPPMALTGGDLVVIPHGRGHILTDQPGSDAERLDQIIRPHEPGTFPLVRRGGGGAATRLICGSFRFERGTTHPLLSVLPPAIVIRGNQGHVLPWLEPMLRFLADEAWGEQPGASTVITRLVDIVFVQAVRAWLADQPDGAGGWLGALRDRRVGEAIRLMHRYPERAWTVASLASAVAMSRSAFAARFGRLVGEPPLAYLGRWRMQLAAGWLRDGDLTLSEIARRLGYESEAAFSKAFKRDSGQSPRAFRRQAQAA